MYRSCIYCSADLGSNDALERFPVGRGIAFDGDKGRLWAVCSRCARWNLAPIEERWEAIEDAERLFRDTGTRAQRESIGLAVLPDGTRLVRVGRALTGELAVWRYGQGLKARRPRLGTRAAGLAARVGAAVVALRWDGIRPVYRPLAVAKMRPAVRSPLAYLGPDETDDGEEAVLPYACMVGAFLARGDDGTLRLRLPGGRGYRTDVPGGIPHLARADRVLHGDVARRVLARGMTYVNGADAEPALLVRAAFLLAAAPSPAEYVARLADDGMRIGGLRHSPVDHLALEMALHEHAEAQALEGELAALQEMWRQAEEVAAIADRLPDLPAPGPPGG